jgi:hypothetical protein
MYIYIYIYIYACMYICVCMCVYLCTYTHMMSRVSCWEQALQKRVCIHLYTHIWLADRCLLSIMLGSGSTNKQVLFKSAFKKHLSLKTKGDCLKILKTHFLKEYDLFLYVYAWRIRMYIQMYTRRKDENQGLIWINVIVLYVEKYVNECV